MPETAYGSTKVTKTHEFFLYSRSSWIIVILLLLSFCAQNPFVSKRSDMASKPFLAFEKQVFDLGFAGPGEKITHTFKFVNTGTAPLKISRISTSCECTAVLPSTRDIPPGGSGEIHATFVTKRYEGKQEETVTVYSNDPVKPEIILTILGIIKTEVAVIPQGINFGNVKKGATASGRVQLLQLSQNTLILNKIEFNEEYLIVKTSRFREENSRGINIDITLNPESPLGEFSEVITLHTNMEKRPRIDVPVYGVIQE